MFRERWCGEKSVGARSSKVFSASNGFLGFRRDNAGIQTQNLNVNSHVFRRSRDLGWSERGGVVYCGSAGLPWWCGPRKPRPSHGLLTFCDSTTLFIDGIPAGFSPSWLKSTFEKEGRVVDVFISKKVRKTNNGAFGFVRFRYYMDAVKAIRNLNGILVKNGFIRVSMARYNKDGKKFTHRNVGMRKAAAGHKNIFFQTFLDGRRYSDVLNGSRKHEYPQNQDEKPMSSSTNVEKNVEVAIDLGRGTIEECSEVIHSDKINAACSESKQTFKKVITDVVVVCSSNDSVGSLGSMKSPSMVSPDTPKQHQTSLEKTQPKGPGKWCRNSSAAAQMLGFYTKGSSSAKLMVA